MPCEVDKYCQANALIAGTDCPNGYVCTTGTPIEFPNWLASEMTDYHLCPKGSYCDNAQTTTTNQCPIGQFMPRFGAELATDCVLCPSGFFCDTLGTIVPTRCTVGSYCPEGSGDINHSIKPTACTPGNYCPEWDRATLVGALATDYPNKQSAGQEFKCGFGFYATGNSNVACLECNVGMMCPGTATATPVACTAGYYCIQKTFDGKVQGESAPRLCDEGKITKETGNVAAD